MELCIALLYKLITYMHEKLAAIIKLPLTPEWIDYGVGAQDYLFSFFELHIIVV